MTPSTSWTGPSGAGAPREGERHLEELALGGAAAAQDLGAADGLDERD
jgi:hypothetical protein